VTIFQLLVILPVLWLREITLISPVVLPSFPPSSLNHFFDVLQAVGGLFFYFGVPLPFIISQTSRTFGSVMAWFFQGGFLSHCLAAGDPWFPVS